MKKHLFFLFLTFIFAFTILSVIFSNAKTKKSLKEKREAPEEWLYNQRAYPYGKINYNTYFNSLQQAKTMRMSKSQTFNNAWQFAGPINIGGRVTDIEMPASDMNTIYAGMASGGIFKSTNQGATWFPIFDDMPVLSIGDIAIDPKDKNTIYAGTGEANASSNNGSFPGNGIYKSTNAGASWVYKGLPASQNIGRIVINPDKPDTLFVAAMGRLYGTNPERGVYRSFNGGNTWQKVLYVNDTTGCIDLAINPDSTNIIYAAMWQRIKYPLGSNRCGAGSGIYKSTDGGNTWTLLTNGLPSNDSQRGRIGIDISQSNPNILYAIYTTTTNGNADGIYKSMNGGSSWSRVDDGSMGDINNGYGWYFANMRIDPSNPNIVYALGMDMWKSTNGGITWNNLTNSTIHVDHHALYIHPLNPNLIINGNDGGVYTSVDAGNSWNFVASLPITQFYTNEIDYQHPQRIYGGAQDNSTSRTMTGALDDWEVIYGGDGFYVLVDPTDDNYVYAEYQYGGLVKSTDGGYNFWDSRNGINTSDRMNWNTPVVFDPSNPQTLYFGSNYLYMSTDQADTWYPISPDLTKNNGYNSSITTIAVASTNSNVIYVGTDDANVSVTTDGGATWNLVSSNLPNRVVTRVAVDPLNAAVAYVTYSGYRYNDYSSLVYRTTNYGLNWTGIAGNLPDAPVNDIIIDPQLDSTLYLATDIGVFSTTNMGTSWEVMGDSMPIVPVFELKFHQPTRTLLAATYGRSMYKYTVPTDVSVNDFSEENIQVSSYPNPFAETTTISVVSASNAQFKIEIYDLKGALVKVLFDGRSQKGKNNYLWSGKNEQGVSTPQGTYICKVSLNKRDFYLKLLQIK